MIDKFKVTAVSYLNTKPFLYGIFQSPVQLQIELSLDIPSVCAEKLLSGEADLGLVPVAVIPSLSTPRIISDYCIGAVGKVATVCIFSNCPIDQLKRVYLDYHSRTSVELAKILLKKYWKVTPELFHKSNVVAQDIDAHSAALVIGDKSIGWANQYPYVYDLGEAWMNFTGLPFVFAAWVSNKELPAPFLQSFNQALKTGLAHIPELIYLLPTPQAGFDLKEYYTHFISYDLDAPKKQAMEKFLEYIDLNVEVVYN